MNIKIVGSCYERKLQKTNQKEFRVEKIRKRKDDKLYKLNGKTTKILLTVGLIKKT